VTNGIPPRAHAIAMALSFLENFMFEPLAVFNPRAVLIVM
jgi:hypothetical protein